MSLPKPIGSCSAEFDEGETDSTYKKVVQDRGGVVESGAWAARKQLSVKLYGIAEAPVKDVPTRGTVRTLNTVPTKSPEELGY
jgi:hypothetical protein